MIYKYVVWDWNGTLLDDIDICVNVMNKLLKERNMPLSNINNYKNIFGFPVRKYYDELGFDFTKEPFEKVSVEFITEYQKESYTAKLTNDAEDTLEFCKNIGLKQIVLSASQIENLTAQINHFGIRDYFETLLGLDHIHATSKVEIGKSWLNENMVDPETIVMIGDTIHDFETSKELNCDVILVADGHQTKDRLNSLGVPVVDRITQIKEYLK